ncbi:MAG: 2-oxo acid dehydrogenase subunit E2 [Gammaproteobacteria bacterium]|nr:2-oxo acid dehydrogenase subunit E2 [Gammaproteobacteria bacterium]
MKTFHLPDLGEGLAEAEILRWKVSIGEVVKVDQPMLEVENAKAVMEVPAPFSGKILKFYAKPGDTVETHKPLVDIETEEAEEEKLMTVMPAASGIQPKKDAGSVVGSVLEGTEIIHERVGQDKGKDTPRKNIKATPAVRALAQKMGVDLTLVLPSGRDGHITPADVEQFSKQLGASGDWEEVPLKGSRRTMALAMAAAHAEVVPASLVEDADIEAWPSDQIPMLRLISAMIVACKVCPALNAWYDSKTLSRKIFKTVNLGIAMDLGEEGLFVPVLHHVDRLKGDALKKAYEQLKIDMKARTLPSESLRGYTIVLSNFGSISGRYASPVVLPPTVAILAAGRVRQEGVSERDGIAIHRILPLSLTFDHRAVTGGEAARFLAAVCVELGKTR